jgi:hypothetical protein
MNDTSPGVDFGQLAFSDIGNCLRSTPVEALFGQALQSASWTLGAGNTSVNTWSTQWIVDVGYKYGVTTLLKLGIYWATSALFQQGVASADVTRGTVPALIIRTVTDAFEASGTPGGGLSMLASFRSKQKLGIPSRSALVVTEPNIVAACSSDEPRVDHMIDNQYGTNLDKDLPTTQLRREVRSAAGARPPCQDCPVLGRK